MRIDDLVTFAADAALNAAEAKATADAWKARAVGEAERIRMQAPGCRDFMSGESRLGSLRLDGADLPAVASVSDGQALAAYLAKHAPDHAEATVTVPADALDLLIGAMESLGVTATARLNPVDATAWLANYCTVVADTDRPEAWKVLEVTPDGTRDVPGVTASRPVPTWKLIPNNDLRKERIAAAGAAVADQVEAMSEAAPQLAVVPDRAPADGVSTTPTTALARYAGARTVRELKEACKAAGLPVSGTGAELQARLDAAQIGA